MNNLGTTLSLAGAFGLLFSVPVFASGTLLVSALLMCGFM